MSRTKLDIRFADLDIRVHQIGKLLDYEKGGNRELVESMIREVLEEAEQICDIRAEYAIFDGIGLPDGIPVLQAGGVDFEIGKIIRGQLKRSESVAFFLCTAGPLIGEKARSLINEKDFLKGYIFDVAGSEIVEAAADLMQEHLRQSMAATGRSITNRFSPGYCGWHVSQQHRLFSLIPDNYCGIILNDSALMQPVKSVSGVIGIGKEVKFKPYTCSFCDQKNCIYRKQKESAEK